MKYRCAWADSHPLMSEYHDREWGRPAHDDRTHYEFLVLEAAQAGLSWLTVLKKREGYRKYFAAFDFNKVARFGEREIQRMLMDPAIIRNELKVRCAVDNAKRFLEVRRELGSFDDYLWRFAGGKPMVNRIRSLKDIPPRTALSDALSKDLKQRGFRFVGSTVLYAHLQAVGIVNDHEDRCFAKKGGRR